MSKIRFKVTRFVFSLDPDTLSKLRAIARGKTKGNNAEAVRYSVRKGYEAMQAESQPPQEPPKALESQESLI